MRITCPIGSPTESCFSLSMKQRGPIKNNIMVLADDALDKPASHSEEWA